jgi:hypothetical protein
MICISTIDVDWKFWVFILLSLGCIDEYDGSSGFAAARPADRPREAFNLIDGLGSMEAPA